ncbi:MAG: 50S ribosomal protein L21e [Candidatus Thermoplasmatota archaeon]|nr:50S ribosomal protein L21e [Candidatus Thermoplasmatota archaeon]MCL5800733.1 50S ribosomal protein L21e [Candidatus Thermoplasmatota archaeon]
MAKMSHGPRSGSRMKMTKDLKDKGFPAISNIMRKFEIGEKAAVIINPSVHSGMPFHNFQGRTGKILRKQGRCYVLEVKVGSVRKQIIAAPVHLKRIVS